MARQTALRKVRIHANEGRWNASFVFPFFDRGLRVRFTLVIADDRHLVFHERLKWAGQGRLAQRALSGNRPLALKDAHPELFHHLFHFDPWWTMREAAGVPSAVRQAIIATNLTARRLEHLVIRDVVFDDNLTQVEEVRVGDGVFRVVAYSRRRKMPQALREVFFAST